MDFTSSIAVGMTHEAHGKVTEENTAATVGSGSLAVYATPAMAALMERAAAELCQRECPDGWTTVGTELHIKHRAATPVGLAVALSVTAYDEREEIGSGTHTRFAVTSDTFMAKAEGKR